MRYRTLYIENEASDFPMAKAWQNPGHELPVVRIRHHKDLFNRPHQCQRLQKEKPALILATRKASFLYEGPQLCQSFASQRFYYASFLQNCPYDCSYCYLQGLYPSADILAFMDVEFLKNEIRQLALQGPAYLALSHDSDLVTLHEDLPYLDHLQSLWPQLGQITAEVRTKSARASFFRQRPPLPNLVFAFSLAPQEVIDRHEAKTPSLEARLHAAAAAVDCGHPIRLCFDPVFCDPALKGSYRRFFKSVFRVLDPQSIRDVSYGFFRLPRSLLSPLSRQRPHAPFFSLPLQLNDDPITFPASLRQACMQEHLPFIHEHVRADKVFLPDKLKAGAAICTRP